MGKQWFTVIVPVKRASGERKYRLQAKSKEEAVSAVRSGNAECESEDVRVDEIGEEDEWRVRDDKGNEV